jgi:hypothetical protein
MIGSPEEEPLSGGRTRDGVVRIGTTVRRPLTAGSPYVHAVLRRLEAAGVDGVPRFLGTDEQGREILSYLEGGTGHDVGHWSDGQLVGLAGLTRAIHDALAGTPEAGDAETVCHNDLAPWNTILSTDQSDSQPQRQPSGFIDFDDASPGPRADDVAYLLWVFLDLGKAEVEPEEQGRRMRLFCDEYVDGQPPRSGADLHGELLAGLRRQQARILDFRAQQHDDFSAAKHSEIMAAMAWVDHNRKTLITSLLRRR